MRGLVLMGKPWLSPGGQGRSPDPGVGADWLWGLAESLSLAVSQFPLLRSERVGLSAAQPLGRWCKGWWARPGLKLPAPVCWVARVGLSPVTFLYLSTVKCGKSLPSEALAESLQFSALPSEPTFWVRLWLSSEVEQPCPGRFGGQHQCQGTWGFLIPPRLGSAQGPVRWKPSWSQKPSTQPCGRRERRSCHPLLPAGRGACWGRGAPTARRPRFPEQPWPVGHTGV